MTDINSVTVVGHLTRDLDSHNQAEFAYTAAGTARANISLAVNRAVKRGDEWAEEVSFFKVTVWGRTAENLRQYFTKGRMIAVTGYLKQDRWKDSSTGANRSAVSIVAESVQLCGGSGGQNDGGAAGNPEAQRDTAQSQRQDYQQGMSLSADGGFAEDIPF